MLEVVGVLNYRYAWRRLNSHAYNNIVTIGYASVDAALVVRERCT